jgi:hypothetical protein
MEPPRLVWCLGMYASGSTWLFNAARAVAALLYPGENVAGHFAETMKPLKTLPAALNVVKTHDPGPAAASFLRARAEIVLVSVRDPRDAVTSMMQHMGHSFWQALQHVEASAQRAARLAGDRRACLFIYESGFTETMESFDRLAAALGGTLTQTQREDLYEATRREKIEEKISQLAALPTAWHNPVTDDLLDLDTQWHRHHSGRSGEVGRWRHRLPAQEAALIERRMTSIMRQFGYAAETSP